ncbi:NAD-binding protein [Haloglomus litoreum]|uniref:NAD-binding protein n=1 Tax=Haloglomus litoreum TaxID=3034026 RepID=UPI0023E7756A|nr:NAD-binding protein [Haloglomus sp. DT116]
MTQEVLVLGGGPIGLEIATELTARGQDVTLLDDTAAASDRVAASDVAVETAASAVGRTAATVVVATSSDARNLMLGAKAPRLFGADRVVALVNDPDRREAFEAADIEPICVSGALTRATADTFAPADPTPAAPSTESDERKRVGG